MKCKKMTFDRKILRQKCVFVDYWKEKIKSGTTSKRRSAE